MAEPKSPKPYLREVPSVDRGPEDPLEEFRHYGTHTIPPGVRLEWLSKPVPRLTEEHLQSTDELDPKQLQNLDGAIQHAKNRPPNRVARKSIVSAVFLAIAIGGLMVYGYGTHQPTEGHRASDDEPSRATLPNAAPQVPPTVAKRMEPAASAGPPTASSMELPHEKMLSSGTTTTSTDSRPPMRIPQTSKGREKKPEQHGLDDPDETLFGPN